MRKTLGVFLSAMLVLPGTIFAAGTKGSAAAPPENAKQNKSEWSLVWSDEFNGSQIDRSKWTYDIGNWQQDKDGNPINPGWGNNEKQYYTDSGENAFVKDGNLIIKAKKEQVSDKLGTYDYTSAKLKTKGLFSKTYGRYEMKAKLPTGKGFWPAFWMLPEQDKYGGWAASGEIDILEGWGSRPNTVAGTIHYGESWPNNKHIGKEYTLPENRGVDSWHTYALEWEPGELRWYVDGELYQTQNNWYSKGRDNAANFSYPAPFDQDFYMILNLAVGGNFDGEPNAATKFPSQMEVDYVRVYDLKKRDYREAVEPAREPVVLPADAKQPLEDGNLIYDQDYEKGFTIVDQPEKVLDKTYWNFAYLPEFGGTGTVAVDDLNGEKFAKTAISAPGGQLHSLQLIQYLSLAQGGKYKVSFDAKSSATRNMMVKLGADGSRGWVKYSNEETIKLTSELQNYEFTFDMLNDTDIAARLEFNLGANGTNPVWIGNVKVEDVTALPIDEDAPKQPLPNGNLIYNGTFDQGAMDRLTYWNFESGAQAFAQVDERTREFHAAIQDGGTEPRAVQLNQKGLYLLKNSDYQLTFKSKAEAPRVIEVGVLSKDGSAVYSAQKVELGTTMEEKSLTFTMPDLSDAEGQLVFNFGGSNEDVYLDDIVLLKTSEDIPDYGSINLNPLKNGDFTNGMSPWSSYIHYDAAAAVAVENGEAKASIGSEGNESWSVILQQEGLELAKTAVYEFSFDARSTKAREAEFSIENAQYTRYFSKVVSLNEQTQHFSYEFTMPVDDIAALKFLLGKNAASPLGSHDVYIDNVVLKVKGAPAVPEPSTSTPGIDNGTFDSNAEHWSSWWGDQWSGYATGTMNAVNGELEVAITNVGGASYSPQVFQKDLAFEKGSSYTVSFEARADSDRKVNVNIGKELSNDPWFIAYAPTQTFDLTSDMQTCSFTFTMNEETFNDGKIVFELGNIAGGNSPATVYFDNVSITKN